MVDETNGICFICKVEPIDVSTKYQRIIADCPHCGKFKLRNVSDTLLLQNIQNGEARIKVSGWVSDENRKGQIPTITTEAVSLALSRPIPTVNERADRFLLEALHNLEHLNDSFNVSDPRFVAATYSRDSLDVTYLCNMLIESDYIRRHAVGEDYSVRPRGYIHAHKMKQVVGTTKQGFVAMWFDERLDEIYVEGFKHGIREAGYEPFRIDGKEHTNKIDDEIIAEIRSSAFVVADFTGHRGGVYFEAGFALGLNLPVIWTCREDHMEDLHFDIRQYNVIDWTDASDLAKRLEKRILATIGKHPESV